MERKSSKFFPNKVVQKFDRKLLALIVSDVGDEDVSVGIKELVILEIGCDKGIRSGTPGIGQKKTARASAHRHALHRLFEQSSVPHTGCPESGFQGLQELEFGHRFGQIAYQSGSDIR